MHADAFTYHRRRCNLTQVSHGVCSADVQLACLVVVVAHAAAEEEYLSGSVG